MWIEVPQRCSSKTLLTFTVDLRVACSEFPLASGKNHQGSVPQRIAPPMLRGPNWGRATWKMAVKTRVIETCREYIYIYYIYIYIHLGFHGTSSNTWIFELETIKPCQSSRMIHNEQRSFSRGLDQFPQRVPSGYVKIAMENPHF